MTAMLVVNGEADRAIVERGAAGLRAGMSAEDVAEQVAREVEDDPHDRSVGFNGLPNVVGRVQLDAAFMEGRLRRAGAVGALEDVRHPISVARAVMERLPHVLLVGAGARRFADEIGAEARTMLTESSTELWRARLDGLGLSEADIERTGASSTEPVAELTDRAYRYQLGHDTMNVLARGADGHLAGAVTTSGVAWKYPGRVGDSPVIGAGLYVDDRYGAAACMGMGEAAVRTVAAARVVLALGRGASLDEAGAEVVWELRHCLTGEAWVRVVVLSAQGEAAAYATKPGFAVWVETVDEDAPRLLHAACP